MSSISLEIFKSARVLREENYKTYEISKGFEKIKHQSPRVDIGVQRFLKIGPFLQIRDSIVGFESSKEFM